MNYDFALITLKSAASASAGYMGMTVGQGTVTMNLTTAGYPVCLPWCSALSLLHKAGSHHHSAACVGTTRQCHQDSQLHHCSLLAVFTQAWSAAQHPCAPVLYSGIQHSCIH